MGFKIAFVTTGGVKQIFPTVVSSNTFFETSSVSTVFPTTTTDRPFFQTSGITYAFPNTISNNAFIETSNFVTAFPVVLSDDTSKLLKLRWGAFNVASDYSTITVPDNTGTYDSSTNPGGYNPEEDALDPNRAKRSEVDLYLAYRIWTDGNIPNTVFPSPVDPTAEEWEYVLPIEEYGVYQIFMIAAPVGKSFEDIEGKGNSIFDFASQAPEWYATSGAAILDPDIINCINRSRFAFVESVICGDCDEGYLSLYSKYIGALSAFEVGTNDAYIQGMALIEEIRQECNKIGCNCNC